MKRFLLGAALLAWSIPAAAAPAAEIVSLTGKGDYREERSQDWRPAHVKQGIEPGQFVRTTQPHSKMSLLLADQTQMTLEGVSFAQVKSPEAAPRRSIIEFGQGKGRFQTKSPSKNTAVRTPTGLAAIRGTEWLVEVAPDGRSAFTVVEGEIELSNEHGSLTVGSDEEGILERGKPPSKRRLQQARERVQWVSAFTVDADRYPSPRIAQPAAAVREGEISRARELLATAMAAADPAPEAFFLAADIEMYFGRPREALAILDRTGRRFPADARVPGLTARAALFADDFEAARKAAAEALARHPGNVESQLAAAEVARLDGDYPAALRALEAATRLAPADWRAWHALGQLQSERSDPRRARRALGQAGRLAPGNATVLAETGMVEANAYDLPAAREILDRALAARPDDFATWTALGHARLKSGDPEGALDALLRATLLEPRSARAHVYLGVAYWQLGRADDALAEMRTASRRDPRDPLPYQLTAMMRSDLLEPGEALAAARESVARLGYLKSLDPIANDLRGSANLGAPFAQMGLEAWALRNAHESFDPLWASSHLFLADRLQGKFTSTSELLQGFLADPLAFGASNRFQSLLARPGHYGTAALRATRSSDATLVETVANANGLFAEGRAAYFVEGSGLRQWARDRAEAARMPALTVGFGARPRDDLGFFFYGNRIVPETRTGDSNALFQPSERLEGAANRFDAGVLYRPGPDWQVWLKGGQGREESRIDTRTVTSSILGALFSESHFEARPRRRDLGVRGLRRTLGGLEYHVVAEAADWTAVDFFERDTTGRNALSAPRNVESVLQDIDDESATAAVGVRWPLGPFTIDAEAAYTRYEKTNAIVVRRDYVNQLVELSDDHRRSRFSPRVGVAWRPARSFTLRGAWQEWLRPASNASLAPASTAGIVLDDRYVLPGGRLERGRVQAEWEAGPRLLLTAYADRSEFDNLYSELAGVLNNRPDSSNLERLRNRSFEALASVHALEGFPQVASGKLAEAGIAANLLAAPALAVFAEAAWADGENTGPLAGNLLPFMPKRRYEAGATWFPGHRLNLGVKATYRGERFADEANTVRLAGGWSGAAQVYWETRDKRFSAQLLVLDIGAKGADEAVALVFNLRF